MKAFNLDYLNISLEYLNGKTLKYLAEKYKVSQWTLLSNFKKIGIRKHNKRTQDINVFKTYTPESCYWGGFLAADGWVSKYSIGLELANIDYNHIVLLRSFLKSNADINKKEYSSIHIYCKSLVNILKENFNIISNKSLTYRPPNIPDELLNHFIRGYIDGDGSIGWHKYNKKIRLQIGSGSFYIIKWIDEIFKSKKLSKNPQIITNIHNRKNPLYSVEYMGHQVIDILNWIYNNSNSKIRLKRKYESYILFLGEFNGLSSKWQFTSK